jgi:hypothetical protein
MAPQIPLDFSDIRRLAITAIFADDYLFERVVLKGGNALSLALGIGDRTSLDLDFSIENDFEDLPEAERHLKAALERRFQSVGLVVFDFKFGPKPVILKEGQSPRWGGYAAEFKLMGQERHSELGNNREALGREAMVVGPGQQRRFTIDLSKFEYTQGKLSKEIDHFQIFVYAPEMIAIEKLRAICQQMPAYEQSRTQSARARDFFDIHLIVAATGTNLGSAENVALARHIFAAKEVPPQLLQSIAEQREFHRPDWDSVRMSTSQEQLKDFDFYFDFVLDQVLLLHTLWDEHPPL